MPKKIKPPEDKVKRQLIANIQYECDLRGIDKEAQRVIARCSQPTYDKKRADPGKFTVDELLRFSKKFGIPFDKLFVERV